MPPIGPPATRVAVSGFDLVGVSLSHVTTGASAYRACNNGGDAKVPL